MERRLFLFFIVNGVLFETACGMVHEGGILSPSANPTGPKSSSLLTRVQQLSPFSSATRVPFGNNGAAVIAINGNTNWNFYVDGSLVGLGGSSDPTLDDSVITVLGTSNVEVRGI